VLVESWVMILNYRKWLERASTMLQVVVVKLSTFMFNIYIYIYAKSMYQHSLAGLIHMVVI